MNDINPFKSVEAYASASLKCEIIQGEVGGVQTKLVTPLVGVSAFGQLSNQGFSGDGNLVTPLQAYAVAKKGKLETRYYPVGSSALPGGEFAQTGRIAFTISETSLIRGPWALLVDVKAKTQVHLDAKLENILAGKIDGTKIGGRGVIEGGIPFVPYKAEVTAGLKIEFKVPEIFKDK